MFFTDGYYSESSLYLERENTRGVQLDLELRYHASVRDEYRMRHKAGKFLIIKF